MNTLKRIWVAEQIDETAIESLLGRNPRPPKMQFYTEATGFPKYFGDAPANYGEECRLNQFYADVAASIQRVTEELLLNMANKLHQETGPSKAIFPPSPTWTAPAGCKLCSGSRIRAIMI